MIYGSDEILERSAIAGQIKTFAQAVGHVCIRVRLDDETTEERHSVGFAISTKHVALAAHTIPFNAEREPCHIGGLFILHHNIKEIDTSPQTYQLTRLSWLDPTYSSGGFCTPDAAVFEVDREIDCTPLTISDYLFKGPLKAYCVSLGRTFIGTTLEQPRSNLVRRVGIVNIASQKLVGGVYFYYNELSVDNVSCIDGTIHITLNQQSFTDQRECLLLSGSSGSPIILIDESGNAHVIAIFLQTHYSEKNSTSIRSRYLSLAPYKEDIFGACAP